MSAAVLYTTKYGAAAKCAAILQEKAIKPLIVVIFKDKPHFDIQPYSKVILGASVYVERIQREMTSFCRRNEKQLLLKQIGLYICSGDKGRAGRGYLKLFGKEIHSHAVSRKLFGSEIYWHKMNMVEKLAMRIIKKSTASSSDLDIQAIQELADEMGLLN